MKLTKVQRVIELFDIEKIENYRVHALDPNRVPNTKFYTHDDIEHKCQVSLLKQDGKIDMLPQGAESRSYTDDSDLLAILVEFHRLKNGETEKYQKMLLIK